MLCHRTLRLRARPSFVAWIVLLATACVLPASAQLETREATLVAASPWSAAIGDFNGDGKLDAAVAAQYLQVLLGKGDGTFAKLVNYGSSGQYLSVATADFDRDGLLDLVVADGVGLLHIYLGNGDGTFRATGELTTTSSPTFVGITDVNGDRKPDLIVVDSPYVSVFLGNGDGTFGKSIDTQANTTPFGVTWGDFNRDGKLDIAVSEYSGFADQVEILLGNGTGTFQSSAIYSVPPEPVSITTSDFRGNGVLDLAVAAFDISNEVSVLLGNGDGTFAAPVSYPTSFPIWVQAADMNGDGKSDLVVANFDVPVSILFSGVSLLLGNGDGTFQPQTSFLAGTEVRSFSLADLNGDGQIDIAVPSERTDQLLTLLNTGIVAFHPTTPVHYRFQLVGSISPPRTVTLTNTGAAPLLINSMTTTGEFGSTSDCGTEVASGASCTITVTFAPKSQGPKSGSVSIVDSASTKPQVIDLTGAGTVVQLTPQSLSFGAQKAGTKSPPQAVQVTNRGTADLKISQIQLTGNNWQDFSENNTCPAQLLAGASCDVSVIFQPGSKGPKKASLAITDNGGGSPQAVALSGTGN